MLLGARNRNEPSLSSRHPQQLISGSEVCRRVIERADSNLNFIRAINGRKHSRPAYGTEVAIVGREHPASGLTPDRHVVCPPDGEEVAERSSLLATYLAVAKPDPHRLTADLKPHLTAVAATHSLPHKQFSASRRGPINTECCSLVFARKCEIEMSLSEHRHHIAYD